MTQTEALKLALEFVEANHSGGSDAFELITAIKEALAQPEQEPVATVVSESGNQEVTMSWWHEPVLPVGTKLYTTPPQRKPLTRGQIREIEVDVSLNPSFDYITPAEQLCRAIEAAHGIKE